jgi:3-oxoacyl-[acyl-carrier protein] reductase
LGNLLQDKIAIITGGARGIGRAIADEFIKEGSQVVILDKFFPEDFEGWAAGKSSTGKKVLSRPLDVTNTKETEQVCNELYKELGKVDVLVNNAGITRDKLIMRMSEEDWDMVLAVNLKGAFNMMKALSMLMAKQRSGKMINISSVVGLMGNAGQANYSASKAGLIGLSKSIAKELAGRGVTVNCIAPGFVETEMTAKLNEDQRNAMLSVIPMKRSCQPSEIAGVVAFVASDKANYITGQVIAVDGGMVM